MKAIGYSRVSTPGQREEGISLQAQQGKIAAWCDLNAYELDGLYTDAGISGKKLDNREGLQNALKALKKGDCLVVYSLSRLSRSTKDTLAIADELARKEVDLVSLSERIDTTSASGKMVFRLLAVLSEFERDQISERTRSAMAHKKANLERVGNVPFGFEMLNGKLIPSNAELAVVKEMRSLRANGVSYQKIADYLNEKGISPKNNGRQWYKATVRGVLGNSIYAGFQSSFTPTRVLCPSFQQTQNAIDVVKNE